MNKHLVWMDLEMTGLDPDKSVIVEIATLVTDLDLNVLGQGPNLVINHPKSVLENMEPWSKRHHEASGLMESIRNSTVTTQEAEETTLVFLSGLCKAGVCPLAGNSVWQDRRFLVRYMPRLNDFLHYRIVDVSTIKELVKRWYPSLPAYEKQNRHTALSDVLESLAELKYYRGKIFLPANAV